jgi:hypothetical protein
MRAFSAAKQHFFVWIFLFVLAVLFTPNVATAQQDEGRSNVVLSLTKAVLFDPTTYAPAALSYTSQRMDWKTSQVLFNAGWVEHNARFTVTGRPDGTPVSFAAGNRQIRRDALAHLQESVVNNLTTQIFERVLAQKYPEHRKLFKTLGWVERITFSSYVGYIASVGHFNQVQKNQAMARQFGLQ